MLISNSSNYFFNSFYVNYSITAKFSDIILTFLVIVFTKNELCCIKIKLGSQSL